jgi:hypothetical protein
MQMQCSPQPFSIEILERCVTHSYQMSHTMALLCFTSFLRKRNWRLRFDRSIVSRSKRVISPNPVITTFFTSKPVSHIDIHRGDEHYPRGYRCGDDHVKGDTYIVHSQSRQPRRAERACWRASSRAPGQVLPQREFHEPLYSEVVEGRLGNGTQGWQSDDRGTGHSPMA